MQHCAEYFFWSTGIKAIAFASKWCKTYDKIQCYRLTLDRVTLATIKISIITAVFQASPLGFLHPDVQEDNLRPQVQKHSTDNYRQTGKAMTYGDILFQNTSSAML